MDNKESKIFILADGFNLFHRQIHMVNPAHGIDAMIGMALHLILFSMKKEYTKWSGTHTVFFNEGRSWRRDVYPDYKAQRKVEFAARTEKEQEDHKLLVEAFNNFVDYLDNKTNVTVLQNPSAEADDMIAIWIEAHPDDQHVLISSDSDFFQLLRHPNLTIYDPVKDILIKQDGIFNDAGKRLAFSVTGTAKIKVGKPEPNFVCEKDWYNYALFLKCIRGDKTDNIFSAYPGVRETGTKNKIGIREAYNDRNNKGYAWNNFMMQKWVDHLEKEQQVKTCYEFNRTLIDLNRIPDNVRNDCLQIIAEKTGRKNVPAVEIGHSFLKFCGAWDLKRVGDHAQAFTNMLKAKYKS